MKIFILLTLTQFCWSQNFDFYLECQDQVQCKQLESLVKSQTIKVQETPSFMLGPDSFESIRKLKNNGKEFLIMLLSTDKADEIYQLTRENLGSRLAIVMDGDLILAPKIENPVSNGQMVVELSGEGQFVDPTVLDILIESDAPTRDHQASRETTSGLVFAFPIVLLILFLLNIKKRL